MGNYIIDLLFMVMGGVMLSVAWTGYKSGELPAGSRGFQAFRPTRDENPIAFHFFLIMYVCFGMWLIVVGCHAMVGMSAPIPLS